MVNPGWYGSGITGPVNPSEAQCYDPAQVAVAHGQLDLQLVSRTVRCSTGSGQITRPYVSGIVTSNGKFAFTHGYIEARVWMPGTGSIADWPAVWAVGHNWPAGGELDVVEGLGGHACWHFHDPSGAPGGVLAQEVRGRLACLRRRVAQWSRDVVLRRNQGRGGDRGHHERSDVPDPRPGCA